MRTLAQAGASLAASDPLQKYERLADECVAGSHDRVVQWDAQGELVSSEGEAEAVWLHLTAAARVSLICQRCLTPVDVDLHVQRAFRFVSDEATAEAEDDEAEEDVLVISTTFDLYGLVEDELLMELPLVPRHAECPVTMPTQAGADEVPVENPNPFAVLATLQTRKLN